MPHPPDNVYPQTAPTPPLALNEQGIEDAFISRLRALKYEIREDICNRATLEKNFRERFEALNRVRLTDAEFARLLDEIVTPDVFTASASSISTTRMCRSASKTSSGRMPTIPPRRRSTSPSWWTCC